MTGGDLSGTWTTPLITDLATVMTMMKTLMELLAKQDAAKKCAIDHLNFIATTVMLSVSINGEPEENQELTLSNKQTYSLWSRSRNKLENHHPL